MPSRPRQSHGRRAVSTLYYGFKIANREEQPAWFHTRQAAERFNAACGGGMGLVETAIDVNPADVMDTPGKPWGTANPNAGVAQPFAKGRWTT